MNRNKEMYLLNKMIETTDILEYHKLFNEILFDDNDSSPEFKKKYKQLKDNKESQDKYLAENKGLEILEYDIETFMPIYKGKRKWVG
jgi:hypothetical protein